MGAKSMAGPSILPGALMPPTIQQRANSLAHKSIVKGQDAARLVSMAEKDEKITKTEVRAMEKVAKLPNDRFEKSGTDVHYSVDELCGSAEWFSKLLGA